MKPLRPDVQLLGPAGPHGSDLVGKPAPDFTLSDLAGKQVKLSELRGSVVLLDFWATWCGPCVMSLPALEKIHQEYSGRGLKVLALNQAEDKEKVSKFIEDKKLTMTVLLDEGTAAKAYQVNAIPMQAMIGKDGTVKKVSIGFNPAGEDELKKLIEAELK